MVQCSHLYQLQGFSQALGNALIGLAWFGNTRGVVVRQDAVRRVVLKSGLDDFAWMHAGPVNSSPEQLFKRQYPVTIIQPQHRKDFVIQVAQLQLQKVFCIRRAGALSVPNEDLATGKETP